MLFHCLQCQNQTLLCGILMEKGYGEFRKKRSRKEENTQSNVAKMCIYTQGRHIQEEMGDLHME